MVRAATIDSRVVQIINWRGMMKQMGQLVPTIGASNCVEMSGLSNAIGHIVGGCFDQASTEEGLYD
jgi:hypothetical protein